MKFPFTHKFGETAFAISSSVLALFVAVSIAGWQNASMVNSALNIVPYRTVEIEGGEEVDTEYFAKTYSTEAELKSAYEQLCEEVESEGIVLLKNEGGALPLASGSNVSLFAQGSANLNYATSGSSSAGSTSSYATLKDALERDGALNVNETLWNFYRSDTYQEYSRGVNINGYVQNEAPYSIYPDNVKDSYANFGDAAIVTIARNSGEGTDSTAQGSDGIDGSYISLTATEVDLLEELTDLKEAGTFDKIIVLVNTALGLQMDFMFSDAIDVDACLWIGNTGSHGAYAIGEVLTGEVNPSGRTVDTFAKDNFSSPAMATWAANSGKRFTQQYTNYREFDFINTTNRYYAVYAEGIYVGYRYYETRYEDVVMDRDKVGDYDYSADVAYPFGYGLSYSTFEYSNFNVAESEDGNSYTVTLNVKNTSQVPGKEVVQIYLQKPYTDGGVEKASVELVGYDKTDTIAAGADADVTITISKEQLRSYDSEDAQTYILDKGDYYLTAAKDSHDAVNNILAAKGYDEDDGMDAAGNAELAAVILRQSDVDTEIFSKSSETGNPITNQLDFADVNRYEGSGTNSVTYLSRSDWEGTFPDEAITLSIATETMQRDLQSNNALEEDGSTMPDYGVNTGTQLISMRGLDYDDERWELVLDQMTYAEQAKLVADGYHKTNEVTSITKPATVDENGPTSVVGSVTGYCLPSEGVWAATFNDDIIERIGKLLGDDAIFSDIEGLYAPGVNIHRTPFGGRAHEYFSEDPYLSGMAAVAEIKGMQSVGVVAYVKHYAFNNEETNRNGVGIWLNEQSAREIYLLPFELAMRPSIGNAHATMTSFNRAGCVWTSASSELMKNILRDEWDFDGFAITDASSGNGASYMTYYDGIMNGTNLYDGTGTESSLDSYRTSARFANNLRESCHRILYVVCNFSAGMNGYSANTRQIPYMPWWQGMLIALDVIAGVAVLASAGLYVTALVLERKKKAQADGE